MGTDESARRVSAAYSSGAEVYETIAMPALKPLGEELVGALPLADTTHVLDAGTGVGSLLPALKAAAPAAIVVGVDGAIGMLARAPREFPLAAMDLRYLGFADGTFDAAVVPFVLFHLKDPREAIVELKRVLRPGGHLGTATWAGDPVFPAQTIWNEELERHDVPPAPVGLVDHEPLSSTSKMRDLLEAEGFTVVRTQERPLNLAYTSETFLALRTGLGSSSHRLKSVSAEQRRAVLDRVKARFAALSPDGLVDRTHAIFAVARR